MVEHLEGKGKLVSRENRAEWQVNFEFDISTEIVKTLRGSVGTKKDSRGRVHALDGSAIPIGKYDLHAEDEILPVYNHGFNEWVVEAM